MIFKTISLLSIKYISYISKSKENGKYFNLFPGKEKKNFFPWTHFEYFFFHGMYYTILDMKIYLKFYETPLLYISKNF